MVIYHNGEKFTTIAGQFKKRVIKKTQQHKLFF